LINRLVFENLRHRPIRTLLTSAAIGIQVTLILTLVGVSYGIVNDTASRTRGTGADLMVRPPDSSVIGFSGNMPEKLTDVVRALPHVALATGVLQQPIGSINTITGINLAEFDRMSGGFEFIHGGPFQQPNDLIVDNVFAEAKHLHVGSTFDYGRPWRVCGIVETGKLSRTFAERGYLQELYSADGKITTIFVKVDKPADIALVQSEIEQKLPTYKIYSMEEYLSLFSVNNIPEVQAFTKIVIGIGLVIGFLVVFLSMYTAVLERTRDIGILKALGAGPGYIVNMLMRETLWLSAFGTIFGILLSFAAHALLLAFMPTYPNQIVYSWWAPAALLAIVGSLIGALYPGIKAARQDPIEALSYD
jgi:putative ABC transport system permease protein